MKQNDTTTWLALKTRVPTGYLGDTTTGTALDVSSVSSSSSSSSMCLSSLFLLVGRCLAPKNEFTDVCFFFFFFFWHEGLVLFIAVTVIFPWLLLLLSLLLEEEDDDDVVVVVKGETMDGIFYLLPTEKIHTKFFFWRASTTEPISPFKDGSPLPSPYPMAIVMFSQYRFHKQKVPFGTCITNLLGSKP